MSVALNLLIEKKVKLVHMGHNETVPLTVNVSGPAELYYESNDTSVDLLVDSVSIQPFSQEEWKSHQDESINKAWKSKVKFQAIDRQGEPLANATIFTKQKLSAFPIGNSMSPHIVNHQAYQNWHNSRFKWTVFENEMKWHINEATPGNEDYFLADDMLKYAKKNDMVVRGHTIIWENPRWLPSLILNFSKTELSAAIDTKFDSIMKRSICNPS
ncbi:hypothetical protein RND71_005755 [Anisodus tanguticus]|uniref:GH10 domain-containing protein n=1 Tax=Anisodus tanguticus TaxID=243964 RepID=A0AAE1ST35_9SOLA|nr:hypothetical protein RND71_005755 [Anisodus tanguticus]